MKKSQSASKLYLPQKNIIEETVKKQKIQHEIQSQDYAFDPKTSTELKFL